MIYHETIWNLCMSCQALISSFILGDMTNIRTKDTKEKKGPNPNKPGSGTIRVRNPWGLQFCTQVTCWLIMGKCLTHANQPPILYWTFFHPKRWMRCGKSWPCFHGKRFARIWALRESSEKHRKVVRILWLQFWWTGQALLLSILPLQHVRKKVRDWLSRALTCRWVRQHLLWETSG